MAPPSEYLKGHHRSIQCLMPQEKPVNILFACFFLLANVRETYGLMFISPSINNDLYSIIFSEFRIICCHLQASNSTILRFAIYHIIWYDKLSDNNINRGIGYAREKESNNI